MNSQEESNKEEILITFDDVDEDEAGALVERLQTHLLEGDAIESTITKESKDAMDFGATLAIVLGSASVVALARGIADAISGKNRKVTIRKKTKDGIIEVISTGVGANTIEKTMEVFK